MLFTIWVEISRPQAALVSRRTGGHPGISTFFAHFRCLGRDIRKAAVGISTFSTDIRCLGRDFRTAALGISTFLADFRCLGRDSRMTALGFSTLSTDFRCLGRDFQPGAAGTPSRIIYNDTYENRALWTKVRKFKKIFIAITPGIQ